MHKRQKYLCLENYNKEYFDFHCLPGNKPPKQIESSEPLEWYTICGTDFENRAEYIILIWFKKKKNKILIKIVFFLRFICILFSLIFYQAAAKSGKTPKVLIKEHNKTTNLKTKQNVKNTTNKSKTKVLANDKRKSFKLKKND